MGYCGRRMPPSIGCSPVYVESKGKETEAEDFKIVFLRVRGAEAGSDSVHWRLLGDGEIDRYYCHQQ